MKTSINIYNNIKLNMNNHLNFLNVVFGLDKAWSVWQVNEDGSFFFRLHVPVAFKAYNLTEEKAVGNVKSFVSHFQERINLVTEKNKNAAYLKNLFKYMKFQRADPFKFHENQYPNHYEMFFYVSLPSISKSNDVNNSQPIKSMLKEAYIKFIVGEHKVFGMEYICPVFTDLKNEQIEIEGENSPMEVTYFYNNLSHQTEFIIRSEKEEIIYVSNKRKNTQRILISNQNRIQSASSLLYFPDDDENILIS